MIEFEPDNEDKIIDLLKKCSDRYYNSEELYVLETEDSSLINSELELNTFVGDIVTDTLYDLIYYKSKDKFPSNQYFKQVGSVVTSGKVKLPFSMGSMSELKEGDLQNWKQNCDYVVSSKLDGISCGLLYVEGILTKAYSRGDGIEGQDISRHVKTLKTIPHKINLNEGTQFIRGELIVPKNEIELMLDELEEETGKRNKNGRNSVSGYINSKNGNDSVRNHLRFVAYHIENWDKSEKEMFDELSKSGFLTPQYEIMNSNDVNEENLTNKVLFVKLNDEYECDGIILTQNEALPGFEGFESGTLNPKKSRKYKIGAVDNITETTVEDIEWNVSKDGLLKPRVKIKPVNLVGVEINWASGHNYKNVFIKGMGKGAKVTIKRSGDVIPKIEEVLVPSFDIPLPDCEYDFIKNDKGEDVDIVYSYEQNLMNTEIHNKYMKEIHLQKLLYFCTKLDIEYAGEGNLRAIYDSEKEWVSIEEFIRMDEDKFISIIGVNGGRLYKSLHQKLNSVDVCVFMDAVNAFGRGIGELKLRKVFNKYNSLCINNVEQLNCVEGFADKTIKQYMDHISDYIYWADKCEELNIHLIKPAEEEKDSDNLSDLYVCFTGVRDEMMENYIKRNGGHIVSSVTKACNLLICSSLSDNSTKMKKAKEKGIDIIDYDTALLQILI